MKKTSLYLCVLMVMSLLVSCKKDGKSLFTPSSSGRPYEVLVVMNKTQWEKPVGRALYDVLDKDVPGLPQSERSFRISSVSPDKFDRAFKIFRNIIVVDIKDIYSAPKFKFSRDIYSSPQIIMTIQSPDEESLQAYIEKNGQVIVDFFVKSEMNRQINHLRSNHNLAVEAKIKSMFDVDVWIPVELEKYKVGKNFLWASSDAASANMNFVIYSFPYTDKNTFTKEYFLQKRDSVMKENIPGEREGMYMATDSMFVDVKDINVKGEYAMEARGLWQMENDMMGGPFVSHSRVDKANGRIVVVEGFIYSPDKLKRNVMRQMEASLYTLQLPNEQATAEIPVGDDMTEEKKEEVK